MCKLQCIISSFEYNSFNVLQYQLYFILTIFSTHFYLGLFNNIYNIGQIQTKAKNKDKNKKRNNSEKMSIYLLAANLNETSNGLVPQRKVLYSLIIDLIKVPSLEQNVMICLKKKKNRQKTLKYHIIVNVFDFSFTWLAILICD